MYVIFNKHGYSYDKVWRRSLVYLKTYVSEGTHAASPGLLILGSEYKEKREYYKLQTRQMKVTDIHYEDLIFMLKS